VHLILATSNPHKVEEARLILAPLGVSLSSLADLRRELPEPVEDGLTFEENARIKARYYARALGERCLAEDSGIEVDVLGGSPGVHSARYSGIGGTRAERDRANNEKLIAAVRGVPEHQRAARFVCTLALADRMGAIVAEARGTYEGVITDAPRGQNGFGYDPLLYLPELGCTSAELTPEQKHARSHRGKALRELVQRFGNALLDAREATPPAEHPERSR
jgi:XTP/dITP diphosphohydrolase